MVTPQDPSSSPYQDEGVLRQLFQRIDINKDGKICSSDLLRVLEEYHGDNEKEISAELAQNFFSRCKGASQDEVTFKEFVNYVLEQDKRLAIAFDHLDEQKHGYVSPSDLQNAFEKFGIHLDKYEAAELVRRVDPTGRLNMNYGQWREFLLLHPAESISDILEYWCFVTLDPSGDADVGISDCVHFRDRPSGRQLLQLTAGAIAGAVSRTCTAPIDRLKLMRQVYGYKHKDSRFTDAYQYMIREGGLSSLWRGNGISVLKIAPETALKYGSYEHYKRLLNSFEAGHSPLGDALSDRPLLTKFLAGSMAGFTAQTIIYPLEVLKTRMCLRKTGQFNSIWHCAQFIYEEHGFKAFYRGYFVNLIGIVPYAGIELALYEACKTAYVNRFLAGHDNNSKQPPHLPTAVVPFLASFSSACGIVVTYPASLIRAKLQAVYWSQSKQEKITAISLIRTIWMDDGIAGLYRGMLTNLTKVLPAVGISLACYEGLRRQFNLGPLGSG